MEQRKPKWHVPTSIDQIDQLLASRYGQLLKWGAILTRGDEGKAQDIVQEFCLYFSLTKPDLRGVANMDGYLHTCLRHIYLSAIARSSREAQHFISVAEFDSFESALGANHSGDLLQRQNDLRRICGYAVWRKESSKTASYFIFHFFHGYSRREIAEIARIPITAVYNKLKAARTEVKSHLDQAGKLRIMNRSTPPEPAVSWGLVSSAELFRELREGILRARISVCLSEEDLLARYHPSVATPISCELLAHIVSCNRCLAVIDRHFRRPTLHEREPLDGFGSLSGSGHDSNYASDNIDHESVMSAAHKRWDSVHEHRPSTLSIAINGKIVAVHDVQSAHNLLSVRIEQPERALFVEVFSEQDVRLALLSIGDLPPEGSPIRIQRVSLSDARWLELKLIFDGLGLDSQVAYFDPALVSEVVEDIQESVVTWVPESGGLHEPSHVHNPARSSWTSAISRVFRPLMPSSAMAWALVLTVVVGSGAFLAYRRASAPINGREIMEQSLKIETTNLQGQTEHQVLQLEEVSADGTVLQQGSVDVWKDGDGSRYLRRLYDSQHHLIASEWRNKSGEQGAFGNREDNSTTNPHHKGIMHDLWDQDLSAQAFSTLGPKTPQLYAVGDGYQLTTVAPIAGHPQFISATLVLDRRLLPIRETISIRDGSKVQEFRLIQAEYELKPSSSVPDVTFDPESELHDTQSFRSAVRQGGLARPIAADIHLTQLQIAVLRQLNDLDVDTGEPIEVAKTPDGYIRVSGTVSDDSLKQKIVSRLEVLPDRRLLELRLKSLRDLPTRLSNIRRTTPEDTSVYDVEQAEPAAEALLRRHFQAKGLSGKRLNSTIAQYSQNVLQNAQRALQHAYALKRLGSVLSTPGIESIGIASQQQWIAMVDEHAQDLEAQLSVLRGELAEIEIPQEGSTDTDTRSVPIENPAQFDQMASQILHQTQVLNSDLGILFTSNTLEDQHPTPDSLFGAALNTIPLRQAKQVARFAARLNSRPANRSSDGDDKKVFDEPQ